MDNETHVFLRAVTATALGVLGLIVLLLWLSLMGDVADCRLYAKETGRVTYTAGGLFAHDCFIDVDGEFVPYERWRVVEE